MNESFVVASLMCILVPFLILTFLEETSKIPKRRSLLEVYKDIPLDEKIKYNMPDVQSKQFSQILLRPSDETHMILRYPAPQSGNFYYVNLDFLDDWKTRNTISPIYSIWMENAGIDRASTILAKKSEPFGKFAQTAKGFGLSPEDIRRRLLQRSMEQEQQRTMEGNENE